MQPGLDSPEFPPTIPQLNSSTIMSFRTFVLPVLGAALLALVPCRAADPAEPASPSGPNSSSPVETTQDITNPLGEPNPDPVVKSLGTEIMTKGLPFARSFGINGEMLTLFTSTFTALTENQTKSSLSGLQKLSEAKLSTEQQRMLAEIANLSSAYLVQRNLATLPDTKGEVAQVVSSLRQGKITESIPALQKIAQNAKLTAPQKELVSALVAKYAPAKALPAAAK